MTKSRQDPAPEPQALRRTVSGERARPVAAQRPKLDSAASGRGGPPPPPKRARPAPPAAPSTPEPEVCARAATSDPILEFGEARETFDSEPPTIALSQPILRLLASESAPEEAEATSPPLAPEPTPSTEATHSESTASVAAVELDTTAPPAELSSPAAAVRERSSGARKQAVVLIAALALTGALVGTRAWMRGHGATWSASRPPSAMMPAPASASKSARSARANPVDASALAHADTTARAAESSAVLPAPLPLVAVDGSERSAPTCDALLASIPSEGERAFNHVRMARQALVRGDADGSQRGFCRAIRAGQTDANVAGELAQVLILRRDAAAALPWAQEAIRLDPSSTRALTLLGDALVRTGNLDEARRAWLRASKVAPDDSAGIERMARTALAAADNALRERDPARAERLLRKVIAFQPENAVAASKLGVALTRLGFTHSAEAWTKHAAELGAAK